MMSLKNNNISIEGKNIVILGAGGASRIITMKLAKAKKANQIIILNRTIENAKEICDLVKSSLNIEIQFGEINRIEEYAEKTDVLINTTPLGMHGVDENFSDFTFLEKIEKGAVIDLIYNPKETTLLKKANEMGLQTLNGLDMLIYQALFADEIYLKQKLDFDELYATIRKKIEI